MSQWTSGPIFSESMNQWIWINSSVNQWISEPMDHWTNDSVNQWTNEPMNQWTNEPISQWPKEPMNQWTSVCGHFLQRNPLWFFINLALSPSSVFWSAYSSLDVWLPVVFHLVGVVLLLVILFSIMTRWAADLSHCCMKLKQQVLQIYSSMKSSQDGF